MRSFGTRYFYPQGTVIRLEYFVSHSAMTPEYLTVRKCLPKTAVYWQSMYKHRVPLKSNVQ